MLEACDATFWCGSFVRFRETVTFMQQEHVVDVVNTGGKVRVEWFRCLLRSMQHRRERVQEEDSCVSEEGRWDAT